MNIIRLNSIGEPFAKSGHATPPSGGGTAQTEYHYMTIEQYNEVVPEGFREILKYNSLYSKILFGDKLSVFETGYVAYLSKSMDVPFHALAFNFNGRMIYSHPNGVVMDTTLGEYFIQMYGFDVTTWPTITEEEFYAL